MYRQYRVTYNAVFRTELRNLSATRWSVRADSIRAVWSCFDEITQGLEE